MAINKPITTTPLVTLAGSDALIAGSGIVTLNQASSLPTPSANQGLIYTKSDGKVYYENDAGVEYDLTSSGSGGTDPIVRQYSSNATWTKPTASNFWGALVICYGAGGGGGGARRGATTVFNGGGGGGGGGGGAIAWRFIDAIEFTLPTYNIVIGAGGLGGARQTLDNTNGINGGQGGLTQFGSGPRSRVIATGTLTVGSGGTTGTQVTGGSGGNNSGCAPQRKPYAITGNNGTAGVAGLNGSSGANGLQAGAGTCGGGGGTGFAANSTQTLNGGQGGSIRNRNVLGGFGSGGTATGNINGGNGTPHAFY